MLAFQGRAGQWGTSFLVGLAFRQRERKALGCVVSTALSLPGLEGAPRSPARARCPHERTKQTLAGLRPRGTGGPVRGYERRRLARHEHLILGVAAYFAHSLNLMPRPFREVGAFLSAQQKPPKKTGMRAGVS